MAKLTLPPWWRKLPIRQYSIYERTDGATVYRYRSDGKWGGQAPTWTEGSPIANTAGEAIGYFDRYYQLPMSTRDQIELQAMLARLVRAIERSPKSTPLDGLADEAKALLQRINGGTT